ncbi:MAG: DUF1232 domain-containing protein [bacterium]|nr:DUF1232 domain-containing protein [bacterium]
MRTDTALAPRLVENVKGVMDSIPSWVLWAVMIFAVLYGLSPLDILPDFLPYGLGFIDDGGVGVFGVMAMLLHISNRKKNKNAADFVEEEPVEAFEQVYSE